MTGDGWSAAVRRQLGLGRVLPLGGPGDGAWLTESAAATVLREAAERVTGVRLTAVRLDLADPAATARELSANGYGSGDTAAVPAPPSALPPGPLGISGDVAAAAGEPLPVAAARLRTALAAAAADRLGLVVARVDLRVTALLEEPGAAGAAPGPDAVPDAAEAEPKHTDAGPEDAEAEPKHADAGPEAAGRSGGDLVDGEKPMDGEEPVAADADRVARTARAVPGVTRLTGALGGLGRAVHIEERPAVNALPRRHIRLELAVAADRRALDVARAVRAAVGDALPDHPSVAVLVTAVE
ncbi:nucleopolyhedrovirus P10 family protein [Streptomyces sp. G45]|uniref:nucleopolyhedrovirus P10 family protein n=1 Tax=Streptomyces sp. G45 TaxID=3406627 RepID=UPI003C1E7EF0